MKWAPNFGLHRGASSGSERGWIDKRGQSLGHEYNIQQPLCKRTAALTLKLIANQNGDLGQHVGAVIPFHCNTGIFQAD